ncbi:T9SS type B sorting domain-containing protein [Maribacter polysaccharolyticus]|uniref:T9SS type B sorting domain-containing protein n=1 Tax=Maribacter polysaccharolyticus TaxID=3020831 RepID=UPI00237F0381|nr:T9SS type B sorting domain-containing protein [Maribacter polysaccharolyticus]MDE3741882.1 T9SS type B sorting domain-containing protein [Maribacter polysaccharolyticus]
MDTDLKTKPNHLRSILLTLIVLFTGIKVSAQLSDLHYLPPLKQGQNNQGIQNQAIYLSTPETTAFTVNAYQGTNTTPVQTFSIDNLNPAVWTLGNGDNNITLVNNSNTGVVLTNSGLRFESPSGKEFYVNYRGKSGSQAASLTAKGRQAMGTSFKWGGVPNLGSHSSKSNTLGIMATEDNTTVTLSGYDSDCEFRVGSNRAGITDNIYTITLDANESFVFETYIGNSPTQAHEDGWIGASIDSDKDIVISNGMINFGSESGQSHRDAGIDQPVPENRLGKEYVFVRGNGNTNGLTEFPLVIAIADNTQIFVNGGTTPIATIDDGEYYKIPSSYYSSNTVGANMLVKTSKDVYAYQSMAGSSNLYTQGLNFVAPVNCLLPDAMDNIPDIRNIAGTTVTGGLTIVASVNTPDENIQVYEDNVAVTMPASDAVAGSSDWKTFFIANLDGDIKVESTGPMAVGFFGYNGAQGVAGYFSGFDTVPEIVLEINGGPSGDCFSGSSIFEASDDNFDAYQWFFDGELIEGANSFEYAATIAGDYYVRGTKGPCTYDSQPITIYYCEGDLVVNKTVDNPEIMEGETATFTIRVENLNFEPVTNLQITDNIPDGLTLISASTTTGTWNGSVWNIGTLEPGEPVFLELEVQGDEIDIDPLVNITNTISHTQDQEDTNITEDILSASIIVHNDFDKDGVADIVDVDDDNDGIYDSDECEGAFCYESIVNESFEAPTVSGFSIVDESTVPGWNTTATDQKIELWESGFMGVNSYNGNQHAEINANLYGALYQNLCLTPGTVMNWSFRHRGRDGVDEIQLKIGADLASATVQQTMASDNTAWTLYSGTYTVPVGQSNTVFVFEAVSTASGSASSGNFIDDVKITIAVPETCIDSDGDGYPNNIDLDSDNDGCSDANEFYKDNTADGGDGGEYGTDTPAVDPDTGAVIGASYTFVQAPNIILENTSEDLGGSDINGQELSLGDTFDYVLRFQNTGDDDATSYTIRDVLPANVAVDDMDVSGATGTTYSHDAVTNIITFEIPDSLVESGDSEYTIRITVTLSSTCSEFVNACSETIENLAYSTYEGVANTNTFSDEPGSTLTPVCSEGATVATNSLLSALENCNVARTVQLCGDDAILSAGTGFTTYNWALDTNGNGEIDDTDTLLDDGDPDGDPSTLLVTDIGDYIVEKSGATDCADLVELITVERFGTTQTNPIITYFNQVNSDTNTDNDLQGEIVNCSIDGSELPQIFLCGENDEATIQLGITDAASIVWQQLDETSCSDAGDDCANTNASCTWTDLAVQDNYTITDSGKYRVVINYSGGCFSRFYFNVFKNTLDIAYISSDILCDTSGNIRITNPNTDYGFQLVDASTDTIVVPFSDDNGPNFDITTSGTYKVQITTLNPLTGDPIANACVFETEEIGILEKNYEVNISTTTADCSGFGTISIQASNALPDYNYEIRLDDGTNSGAGTFFQEMVAIDDNNYTFNSVPPGDYIVITTTEDGCTDTQNITVDEYPELNLSASLTENITCNAGMITLSPTGGNPDPDYDMAIWSKDGVALYATADDVPDTALQTTNDFLFLDSSDVGEYVFIVFDDNGCSTLSNSVTISDLGPVVVSASHTAIVCADSSTATLTITASGGTAPYEYSVDGGTTYQSTNVFTNMSAGEYTITVRDSSGTTTSRCSESITYEIDQPYRLTASAAIVEDASCDPAGALVKILNANGGGGTYLYSFDGGSNYSGVNEQRLTAGTYSLSIKDNLGCTYDMELTVPSTPVDPNLDSDVTYDCDGNGTITITSDNTTDFTYTYSLDGTLNSPEDSNAFSNIAPGTYQITVGYSSTVSPNESTLFLENFGTGSTTQIGEIGPGYCYEPQDGTDTDCNLGPAGILVNGEYAVTNTVTNPNTSWRTPNDHTGLTNGRFMAIGVSTSAGNNNILWSRNDLEVLADQDITISFYAYNLLVDGASGNDPEVLVELVDASGTVINSLATTAIPQNNDADDWHLREVTFNPGANTMVGVVLRTNLDSDDGNFLVLDDIQASQTPEICEQSQDLTVIVEDNQEFSVAILSSTNPTCNGNADGSIRFEVKNFDTATGYEYSTDGGANWTTETGAIVTTPSTLADGTYAIMVQKVSDNTCMATSPTTVTLTAPTAIVPDLQQKAEYTCYNTGATLEASATGGTPGYEYQLEDTSGTPIVSYQTSTIFNNVADGDYLIRVRDTNGCEVLSTATVTVDAPETIAFDTTFTTCYDGANDATITVDVTSGNGGYTFRINGGAWQTPTPSTDTTYTFSGLSNGSYDVEVSDAYGCPSDIKTINIAPELTLSVEVTHASACGDGTLTATAVGGDGNYVYAFIPNGNTVADTDFSAINTYTVTLAEAGNYDVYVRDNAGNADYCGTMITEEVEAIPTLMFTATPTDAECNGGTGRIIVEITNGSGPYDFELIDVTNGTEDQTQNDLISNTKTYYNLPAGTYDVKITDAAGCSVTESNILVDEPVELTADIKGITPANCTGIPSEFGFDFENYPTSLGTIEFSSNGGLTWQTSNEFRGYTSGDEVAPSIRTIDGSGNTICQTDLERYTIPYPLDDLDITVLPIIVNCDELQVSVRGQNGTAPYEYTYSEDSANFDPVTPANAWTTQYPSGVTHTFPLLIPGRTYTFYVRDAVGCVRESSVNVNDIVTNPMDITADISPSCNSASNGIIEYTISSNFAPSGFDRNWTLYDINGIPIDSGTNTSTDDTISVANLAANEYYIVVEEVDGSGNTKCISASENAILSELDIISGTPASIQDISCENPGIIEIPDITGGGGTYYYTITGPSPFTTITATDDNPIEIPADSPAGTYSVSVEDQYGCSYFLADVPMNFMAAPVIDNVAIENCDANAKITINMVSYTGTVLYSIDNGISFQTSNTFDNIPAGNYDILVKDETGCTDTLNIDIYPTLQATASLDQQLGCGTGNEAEIKIEVSSGSGTYEFEILDSALGNKVPRQALDPSNSQNVTIDTADTYTVNVYDTGTSNPECFRTFSITVPTAIQPDFSANVTDVSCSGSQDGVIELIQVNNGNNPLTYSIDVLPSGASWDGTTQSYINLPGGTYEITGTGPNGCTSTPLPVIVNENPAITFDFPIVTQFGCTSGNTSNNALIPIDGSSVSGGTGTYNRFVFIDDTTGTTLQDGSSTTYSYTDQVGGVVNVRVYDSAGCYAEHTVTIDPFDVLESASINIDENIDCINAGEDISIDVTGTLTTYTTAPANYEFRQLPSTTYQASNQFTDLAIGTHTFGIKNITTGCEIQLTHIVEEPNTFDITVDVLSDVVCYGDDGSIQITFSDATYTGNFEWEVLHSDGTSTTRTDDAGTYTGTGTTATIPVAAGNYIVRVVQDAFPECSQERAFTITTPEAAITLDTIETSNVGCSNGEGTANIAPLGGKGAYDIVLTNTTTATDYSVTQVNANLFQSLEAGTYNIIVTDALGCTQVFTSAFTLIAPDPITGTVTQTELVCEGDTDASISFVPDTRNVAPNYSYSLNTYDDALGTTLLRNAAAQTSPDFYNLGAGFYSISITDDIGCTYETNIVEIEDPTEVDAILITESPMSCQVGAELLLVASGGTAPYTWSEDGVTFNSMNETNGTDTHLFQNVTEGTYTYYVRDDYNCVSIISNEVTINAIGELTLTLDTSAAKINCSGDTTAVIIADADGGLGSYEYALFADATLTTEVVPNQTDGTFTDLSSGTYYVRVQSRDCELVSEAIVIEAPTPLTIDYEITDITCNGEDDGSIVINLSGGSGDYMYAISPNLNQFVEDNTFDGLAPGDYTVIAQDSLGCYEVIEFTITEPSTLEMTVTVQDEICYDSSDGAITLEITGGTAPYYTSINSDDANDFVQDRLLFENLSAGYYGIYVKDANGCTINDLITVEVGVNLNATTEVIYECTGDTPNNSLSIALEDESVGADVLYALDSTDANDLVLDPDFSDMSAGPHYVTIAHANGCIRTFDFEVIDYTALSLSTTQENINEITAIVTGGKEGYTYYFDGVDNGNDSTYTIDRTDTYEVRVVDENGCEAISTIYMEFIDIEIPNFFTPDGDGNNDVWTPINMEIYPDIFIKIYDRYGRIIYRFKDNQDGWDGFYNNTELPTGDYWYIIKLNGETDEREFVGHFTLYR